MNWIWFEASILIFMNQSTFIYWLKLCLSFNWLNGMFYRGQVLPAKLFLKIFLCPPIFWGQFYAHHIKSVATPDLYHIIRSRDLHYPYNKSTLITNLSSRFYLGNKSVMWIQLWRNTFESNITLCLVCYDMFLSDLSKIWFQFLIF